VNDGSTDSGATEEIALSYGNRIRYFRKENGGVASALNAGVAMMAGEYFSWLSHDDVYLPEKVSVEVDLMSRMGKVAVLYSDFDLIDEHGTILGRERKRGYGSRDGFRRAYPVHGCTTLIPRECFKREGLFDEKLRTSQDYDFWFRLAPHYEFIHIPESLIHSRVHGEQGTIIMSTVHMREANDYLVRGMRGIVADQEMTTEGEDAARLLRGECAVDFRRRGFVTAGATAFADFRRSSGGGRLCLDSRYRSIFLKYQLCLLRRIFHLVLSFLPARGVR
jgi:glycosyltransferase involved in cell wall biosynthesis